MSENRDIHQSFRIFHYDLANWQRWKYYYPNTYWVNHENETYRDVHNLILCERPGVDQAIEPIYPFLALRRLGTPEPEERQNMSLINRGLRYPAEEMRMTETKFILTYNLDIYSARREELDDISVELFESFMRNPDVQVLCPDPLMPRLSTVITHQSTTDNTDLINDNTMRIFRATIAYTTTATIFRRYRHQRVERIETDFVFDNASVDQHEIAGLAKPTTDSLDQDSLHKFLNVKPK